MRIARSGNLRVKKEDFAMLTYSISLHLQRIKKECAYVSVPVTDAIMIEQADGTGRIDADKMTQIAISLSEAPDAQWHFEEQVTQPHPIQKAPEPDEK